MSNHSNKQLTEYIHSSEELTKKINLLNNTLIKGALDAFKIQSGGINFPNINEAMVRILEVSMHYYSDNIAAEYINGIQGIVQDAEEGNYPKLVKSSVELVINLFSTIFSTSGGVKFGATVLSETVTSRNENNPLESEKTFVVCALANVADANAQVQFNVTSFYIASYAFAIWEVKE